MPRETGCHLLSAGPLLTDMDLIIRLSAFFLRLLTALATAELIVLIKILEAFVLANNNLASAARVFNPEIFLAVDFTFLGEILKYLVSVVIDIV